MTRRRMTWSDRMASAPPATPGYAEGTDHPAYGQPDPEADQYMNGDPSSWAEDPHPGPYPNSPPPPADPGMQEPQGHPATDPKHYFPAGVGKEASRDLRAAMEHKASKCIRIAQAMLGRKASVEAIEDQALDLMNISDRQIQAMLTRISEQGKEGTEANYTLTKPRTGDDLLADEIEEEDVVVPAAKKAGDDEEEVEEEIEEAAKKAAHFGRLAAFWAKAAKKSEGKDEDEALLAEMEKEEAKKAAGGQNDPATYMAGDDSQEEKMLAEMLDEEAKKAAVKGAKKSEDEETKEEEPKKEAKKSEDEETEEEETEKKSASVSDMLSGLDEPMMDDEVLMDDPMALMDSDDVGMSDEEMSLLYGTKFASKATKKAEDEEVKDEDEKTVEEAKKEAKARTAALKPQPRRASTGVKTLGQVSKTAASSEISDLSKLWESAPDVSKIFG